MGRGVCARCLLTLARTPPPNPNDEAAHVCHNAAWLKIAHIRWLAKGADVLDMKLDLKRKRHQLSRQARESWPRTPA